MMETIVRADFLSQTNPLPHMLGWHSFDPETGAPLSEDKHYHPGTPVKSDDRADPYRQGARTPVEHPVVDWHSGREGALTNGELCSSLDGLIGYFRRMHRRARPPNPKLDQSAALAFKRLKSAEEHVADSFVWYCAAERLARKGHWAAWMLDHTQPRCPRCNSTCKFRPGMDALEPVCASSPSRHGSVEDAIRTRITELYEAAFDETIAPDDCVLF